MNGSKRWSWLGSLATLGSLLALLSFGWQAIAQEEAKPLRALIIGGGPNLENNQASIESHIRYVGKLLPPGTHCTTLFADGNPERATVLYEADTRNLSIGERLFELLLSGSEQGDPGSTRFRKPNLGLKLNGAARKAPIMETFNQMAQEPDIAARPLFLYFTGHGSPDRRDNENNRFDLWGKNEQLSVRDLANQIAKLPDTTPVTLVMVQCYSGSFANLLFEGGDPQAAAIDRDFAGFFSVIKEKQAAGCTTAISETDYQDFSTYFFAALTGRDRVGRKVTGADYNADGRVTMHEAYCYTLIHDNSIDIPTCTSDIFLRRFVRFPDEDVFNTPYSKVLSWATPAQRAVLEGLSKQLNVTGEERLAETYRKMMDLEINRFNWRDDVSNRRFENLRSEGRRTLFDKFPTLANPGAADYKSTRRKAITYLTRQAYAGQWKELLDMDDEQAQADLRSDQKELQQAKMIRFVRMGKSIVLAHELRERPNTDFRRGRFEKLMRAENRTLLKSGSALPSL